MLATCLLLVTTQFDDGPPYDKYFYFRGAETPNSYFSQFVGLPNPWDEKTKLFFARRIFEAYKTEKLWKRHMVQFYIIDDAELFANLTKNFPSLRDHGYVESATVWTIAKYLRLDYYAEFVKAKPFLTKVYYRGEYPSPNYYIWRYMAMHTNVSKAWLLKELKLGADWEAKNPSYDDKISFRSSTLEGYRKLFPSAKPKAGPYGYTVWSLYSAVKDSKTLE